MTTCGPTLVPRPISTPGPMTENGPTSTPSARTASGAITAVGWIMTPVLVDSGISARHHHHFGARDLDCHPPSHVIEYFQIVRIRRSSVAFSISWSPGTTGRRKRALSMPAK